MFHGAWTVVTGGREKIALRTTQACATICIELNGFRVAQAFLPVLVFDFLTASCHPSFLRLFKFSTPSVFSRALTLLKESIQSAQ
jgi:hypothetical protein